MGPEDSKVIPELFLDFWNKEIIPEISAIPEELSDQNKMLDIYQKNYIDLVNIVKTQIPFRRFQPMLVFLMRLIFLIKLTQRGP